MPELSGSAALDVVIGLAFVYLLFSLLCSLVQEAIASVLDLRAKQLEKGLRNLLNQGTVDSDTDTIKTINDLAGAVYGHPLIGGLQKDKLVRKGRRGPSYIPARTFALALLDTLAPDKSAQDPVTAVQAKINTINVPAETKQALLALTSEVGESRDKLRAGIEEWFDAAMARVSGWYRREAQIIVCVLSLAVAVGMNVNTIAIADRLVRDESIRNAVAQKATKLADSGDPADTDFNEAVTAIEDAQKLGLPIGWNKEEGDPAHVDWGSIEASTLGGWLLTFLALSLGAPFWFDALSKLTRLRMSGRREESRKNAG